MWQHISGTYGSECPHRCRHRSHQTRHKPSGCKCSGGSYTQTVMVSRLYLQSEMWGIKEALLLLENKDPARLQVVSGHTTVNLVGTVLTVIFTVTCPARRDAAAARTRKEGQGTLCPPGPWNSNKVKQFRMRWNVFFFVGNPLPCYNLIENVILSFLFFVFSFDIIRTEFLTHRYIC